MKIKFGIWALALLLCGSIAGDARADNTWGPPYHWARTANPVPLNVIESVTSDWQSEFDTSLIEWSENNSQNAEFNFTVTQGQIDGRTRKKCAAVEGQITVCNARYGGLWYGRASINVDGAGHIIKGTAKMNDSWALPAGDYNRNHLMCQEIGHLFGLGHTSVDGTVDDTCMDYSWSQTSASPNDHDYLTLADIYAHLNDPEPEAEEPKACNPKSPKCTPFGGPEIPPMGVRVHKGRHHEVWVARGRAGSLWIHHVRLVPEELR